MTLCNTTKELMRIRACGSSPAPWIFFLGGISLVPGRAWRKETDSIARCVASETESLRAGTLRPSLHYYLGAHQEDERGRQPPLVLFETLLAPRRFPQKNAISSNASAAAGLSAAQLPFF